MGEALLQPYNTISPIGEALLHDYNTTSPIGEAGYAPFFLF